VGCDHLLIFGPEERSYIRVMNLCIIIPIIIIINYTVIFFVINLQVEWWDTNPTQLEIETITIVGAISGSFRLSFNGSTTDYLDLGSTKDTVGTYSQIIFVSMYICIHIYLFVHM
jgi:hypothetical protein